MNIRLLALLLAGLCLGCLHQQNWFRHQDPSIQMPAHESIMADSPIDGPTLRALQIAAHDFFPAWGPLRSCIDTPEAHKYHALRRGEVIYVAISQDPGYCGRAYSSLDSGVRYAISVDGRILRRLLDGEPDSNAAQEEDVEEQTPGSAAMDASDMAIDVTVPPGTQVSLPFSHDGGLGPTPDGGVP